MDIRRRHCGYHLITPLMTLLHVVDPIELRRELLVMQVFASLRVGTIPSYASSLHSSLAIKRCPASAGEIKE